VCAIQLLHSRDGIYLDDDRMNASFPSKLISCDLDAAAAQRESERTRSGRKQREREREREKERKREREKERKREREKERERERAVGGNVHLELESLCERGCCLDSVSEFKHLRI
jgi:topoisomerase IA-like protein